MDNSQESFETWNRIAALYQSVFMELDLYNDTYDAFCSLIAQQNPEILEVGCGPGNITRYLLARRPDLRITGIDIAPDMIALARANNPAASFLIMDGRELRRLQGPFDAIICGFFLPYLSAPERGRFIGDCAGLLSAGGVLYVSYVEGDPKHSSFQTGSSGGRIYFNYHRPEDLEADTTAAGLELLSQYRKLYSKRDGSTEQHTILILKKGEGR